MPATGTTMSSGPTTVLDPSPRSSLTVDHLLPERLLRVCRTGCCRTTLACGMSCTSSGSGLPLPNRSSPRAELANDEDSVSPLTAEPFASAFGTAGFAGVPALPEPPVLPGESCLPAAADLLEVAADLLEVAADLLEVAADLLEVAALPAAPLFPDTLVFP